jgi:hypothetical protein
MRQERGIEPQLWGRDFGKNVRSLAEKRLSSRISITPRVNAWSRDATPPPTSIQHGDITSGKSRCLRACGFSFGAARA